MERTFPVMLMFLMVLVNTATATATVDQHQYLAYSPYLPAQAAHPPVVYQLSGMPLPLKYPLPAYQLPAYQLPSYQIPSYHVPGVAIPGAGTPAAPESPVFIQRLANPPAATVPVAGAPVQYGLPTVDDCKNLVTQCLGLFCNVTLTPLRHADDQPLAYAQNPVHQPILLEEAGKQATYPADAFTCVFGLIQAPLCLLNPDVAGALLDSIIQLICECPGFDISNLPTGVTCPEDERK